MISEENKFIFICNMRVLSQSISKTLEPFCLYDHAHYTAFEIKSGNMESAASRRGVFIDNNKHILERKKHKWDDYFKFAFVRNPYEHFLSVYKYLVEHSVVKEGFKEYTRIQGETNYSSMSDWNFTGLFDRISDKDDNIIIDFVGRYENLQEDWSTITEKIGLNLELKHINSSNFGDTSNGCGSFIDKYYTDNERDVVRNLYKKDFDKFGYDL